MPMPELDPARYVAVLPADPTHRVPTADGSRIFSVDPANPDRADIFDPYVAQLLADGSLRRACDVETAAAKAVEAKAVEAKAVGAKAGASQDNASQDNASQDNAGKTTDKTTDKPFADRASGEDRPSVDKVPPPPAPSGKAVALAPSAA